MQLKGVFCLHIDNKTMQIVAQSYEFIYSRQIFFNKKVEFRTILPSLAQNIPSFVTVCTINPLVR